jgi:hypothetical protein
MAILAHLIQSASSLPTDASALESAISALERDIRTLENSSVPSERALPWFTAIIAIGVALELWVIWRDRADDMHVWRRGVICWPPDRPSTKKFIVEIVSVLFVTGGIVGELWAGVKITQINGSLRSKGAELRSKSDQLLTLVTQEAGTAKVSAEKSAAASQRADADAERAKNKADVVAKLAKQLHEFLTGRSLTQKEMDDLRDSLKPLADANVPILVTGSWESGLVIQVWDSLKRAGFEKAKLRLIQGPVPYGMGASSPPKHAYLADEITGILRKAGIGPMVGGVGLTADTEPIEIFIGDIRMAPLPLLK